MSSHLCVPLKRHLEKKEKAAVLVHKKRKICLDREKVHPLHWLSSGYFEKLRAFCTLRTHFVTGIADFSVCIERSGHICTLAAKKIAAACLALRTRTVASFWTVARKFQDAYVH